MGLALALSPALLCGQKPLSLRFRVDAGRAVRTMQGGIGASFHAIEEPIPGQRPSGGVWAGSAWGANPPAEDEAAWQSIYRHADWLGLDWCRVELEQRMYEPRRREFTWDNPEMRILYRILDWAERRGVDVFLQQMWANVEWNAWPELRGSMSGRLVSSPASLDEFAYGLGELAEHLTKKRGYKCIRWLSISNEPGWDWSWWQGPDRKPVSITPAFAAVRKELDRRGIRLPVSGPDWTDLPELEPARIDFDPYIGAYDLHSYLSYFDGARCGYPLSQAEKRLADWSRWAHGRGKPMFLSELGTMVFGFRGDEPGPGIYESGLKDAALAVRAIRAGVDGLNRWSMINRGDLDGQWQLLDTWEIDEARLKKAFTPHPNTYYLFGILSRLTALRSDVLAVEVEGKQDPAARQLVVAALRSPKGRISVLAVNETYRDVDASIALDGLPAAQVLHRYAVTGDARDRIDYPVEPGAQFSIGPGRAAFTDRIPRLGVVVYSSYELKHAQPGIATE
jgi:hypothetical protein